jgi:hypothetical protein
LWAAAQEPEAELNRVAHRQPASRECGCAEPGAAPDPAT